MLLAERIELVTSSDLCDDLDLSPAELIAAAIEAGVQDFAIDDEPFETNEIESEIDSLDDQEQERVTFALEGGQIERFSWLTGKVF